MRGLMLHCGAEHIERQALHNAIPPAPMGPNHNPIPFGEFVDLVADELDSAGLTIKEEGYGLTGDGQQFFGLMHLTPKILTPRVLEGEFLPAAAGKEMDAIAHATMLGLRGSYNQTFPRALALGDFVFVCDNLSFSGEITLSTKQTTNIMARLPGMIHEAVGDIPAMIEYQEKRIDAYKNTEFKPRWGDAALTECLRRGILNQTHMGRAVQEWDTPSYDEHAEQGHSVWRFHNAITEVLKPTNGRASVVAVQKRTIPLTSFLDEVVGFG